MINLSRGFINKTSTQIMPGDNFSLTLVLVDQQGAPINLRDGNTIKDLQVIYLGMNNGWRQAYETPDTHVVVVDADKGMVTISMEGGEFDDYDGYKYAIRVKASGADESTYQSVATGEVEVFNL
jgi:hypothetical protein